MFRRVLESDTGHKIVKGNRSLQYLFLNMHLHLLKSFHLKFDPKLSNRKGIFSVWIYKKINCFICFAEEKKRFASVLPGKNHLGTFGAIDNIKNFCYLHIPPEHPKGLSTFHLRSKLGLRIKIMTPKFCHSFAQMLDSHKNRLYFDCIRVTRRPCWRQSIGKCSSRFA